MKAALVIMAAGMGSRYGGSKQVDGIGPDGEILMEYSIYDAIRAGFTKVVFIIKPEMRELVETLCGRRVAGMTAADGSPVEVCYAYQDFSSVPAFYSIPTERTKPFGTGHAVLCARSCVGEPFIVINADDYYGVDAFRVIYEELGRLEAEGEAQAILAVQKANADAIRLLNEAMPNDKVLALRSLEALAKVANGKATKIIIPSELQNLGGVVPSIKELMTDPKDAE